MNADMAASLESDKASARWLRVLLVVALLGAFALRLVALDRQDIWWDEARNLDVALRPIAEIAVAPELDIQPPVYYWLLHGWLAVAGIERGAVPATMAWGARWLSLWAGVAGVALTAMLAKRVAGQRAAAATAILAAASPFWLAESQETRMYTAGLALLAAAAYLLLRLVEADPGPRPRWGWLVAFAALSAAALLVHYNAVFVLAAWYAWWLLAALFSGARSRRLRDLALAGLATALLVLPILPIALRQIPGYENPNLVVPAAIDYLRQNWQGHIAGYAWDASALRGSANWWLWGLLAAATAGLGLLIVRRMRADEAPARRRFLRELAFLGVWLGGGLLLYYVAVLDRGAFNVRYSAFVTPALYVLVGSGIAGWGRRLAWPLLALLAAGLISFARADLYDPRFAREEIGRVTEWLRAETRPGDLVLVDQKYPFGFYYDRYAVSPEDEPAGDEVAPARYLFVDINTIDDVLNAWAADAGRIFWVQWFESDTDPRHAVTFLLDSEGKHVGEEWFQGWSVDWWEMDPPTHFALAPDLQPIDVRFPAAAIATELSAAEAVPSGEPLPVAIRWRRSDAPVERPLKARVALYDVSGNRVAQADERLLNDRHRAPSEWSAEDSPLNVYLLVPDTPLPPGSYELRLLVYDADTLAPLDLADMAGNPAGIEATLGQVRIDPHQD